MVTLSLLVSLIVFVVVVVTAVKLSLVVDYANSSFTVLERLSLCLTVYERIKRG